VAITPYVKQTWTDGSVGTPVSAARLGVIESGIYDSHYRPWCVASRATNQSFSNGVTAAFSLDAATQTSQAVMWAIANPTRVTVPVTGTYVVAWWIAWAAAAGGVRQTNVAKNGVWGTVLGRSWITSAGATYQTITTGSTTIRLTANDYLELLGYQDSGGALNALANDVNFSVSLVSY